MPAELCANFRSLGKFRPILGQLPPTIAPAQSPRQENPQLLTAAAVITDQDSFFAKKFRAWFTCFHHPTKFFDAFINVSDGVLMYRS